MDDKKIKEIKKIIDNDFKKITPFIEKYIKNKKIADVGCGTGFVSSFISERYNSDVIMLDVEDNRLIKNTKFKKVFENNLCLKDNSVDLTYIQFVLHHLRISPVILLKEAFRISKKELILIEEINNFNKKIKKFIDKDIEINKILHPKTSFPIVDFLKEKEIEKYIKESGWVIKSKKVLDNKDYLPVNIYILYKSNKRFYHIE